MDPVLFGAVATCVITPPAAVAVLWGFVLKRFESLEKANKLCEERARKNEVRIAVLSAKCGIPYAA